MEIIEETIVHKTDEMHMAVVMPSATERDFEDGVELFLEQAGWKTFREERLAGGGFMAGQKDYDR